MNGTHFECRIHHAATMPEMAPLAPREVTVSLLVMTCADRDTKDAKAPDAR